MLKIYIINGKQWLFEEGKQPAGAVEYCKPAEVPAKAKKPANKARKAATK